MLADAEKNGPKPAPLIEAFRRTWGRMIIGIGIGIGAALLGVGGFFLMTTFIISYGTDELGIDKSVMLNATVIGSVVEIVVLVVAGRIADRIGAWTVCAIGGLVTMAVAFPAFWLVDTGKPALVYLGVGLGIGALSIPYAPIGAVVSGMFPEAFRYSAVAMSYNLAGVVAGFVPLLATSLTGAANGASWGAALLLMVIAACTAAGSFASGSLMRRERAARPAGDRVEVAV
ncbi:MFS transporter [Streptomyces atratus]